MPYTLTMRDACVAFHGEQEIFFSMIKRVLVVSMVGLSLVGCVNNDTLSGDVYTASEAKQVQNFS